SVNVAASPPHRATLLLLTTRSNGGVKPVADGVGYRHVEIVWLALINQVGKAGHRVIAREHGVVLRARIAGIKWERQRCDKRRVIVALHQLFAMRQELKWIRRPHQPRSVACPAQSSKRVCHKFTNAGHVLVNPGNTILERSPLLTETVGGGDFEPPDSALADWRTLGTAEQRPDVVAPGVIKVRDGPDTAAPLTAQQNVESLV